MEVKWVVDERYVDCWDLCRGDEKLAFTIRSNDDGVLAWRHMDGRCRQPLPSQDVEEAKAIIQAMVLLEG